MIVGANAAGARPCIRVARSRPELPGTIARRKNLSSEGIVATPERGRNTRRRATRYSIASTLLYREQGARRWRQGRILNVSRTGVLFQPDEPMPVGATELDFVMSLPLGGGLPAPRVRCVGHVVRGVPAGCHDALAEVAVSIDGWKLEGRPLN